MNEIDKLKAHVSYCPETGDFVRKLPTGLRGRVTGHQQSCGYIQIVIDRKYYYAHRLAWLFVTGSWPKSQIDHIDGDRKNNRFSNLREASNSENQQNTKLRSDNTSGFPGVSWSKKANQWKAKITIEGRQKHISYRDTPEQAYADYLREKQRLHVFQPAPRSPAP